MCLADQMWPEIIASAKHGGLNVIQTYVFWNLHEPVQGQVLTLIHSCQRSHNANEALFLNLALLITVQLSREV